MNNRGIHFTASTDHSWALANWEWVAGELAAMGIHWVKVLDDGAGSSKEICRRLIAMGIKVIVRLYRPRPNPGKLQGLATTVPRNPWLLSAANLSTVEALVAIGVEFFEVNNEPNVPEEWDPAAWQASSLADKAKIVAYNWMSDAENVIKRGGRPAFPALAPCGHTPEFGSVLWYEAMFKALQRYQPSVTSLFNRGAWLAVHVGPVNHFYRDNKGQWRFEYPYDPICQADKPGLTIYQDDNGLLGYRVPQKMLKDLGLKLKELKSGKLYRGRGCEKCLNTGYIGRLGIYELLVVTNDIRKMILAHADSNQIKEFAMDKGMITLLQDGLNKAAAGLTTVEEVIRVS